MAIGSYIDYQTYLRADLNAAGLSRWTLIERGRRPILAWQRQLRRLEYYSNCKGGPYWHAYVQFLKWRFQHASIRLGFDIHPNCFGPGLSVAHWGTLTVNSRARIGAYCRIHPSTTIGERDGKAPVIGDHAYIAPGARIYGGITLGHHVTVGANAVVGRSFPQDGITLVGAPARIVSEET